MIRRKWLRSLAALVAAPFVAKAAPATKVDMMGTALLPETDRHATLTLTWNYADGNSYAVVYEVEVMDVRHADDGVTINGICKLPNNTDDYEFVIK